ncbi:phage integrase N-terminal SAM-like domain-containing protein [Candidatus Kuenenia sp.]|uniref:phage integrase N-terminal SAM-like domain-containing protein n=1 Tax=Candidatus Kuenenia sp. TaxID=2499824 RepID=UPI00322079E8
MRKLSLHEFDLFDLILGEKEIAQYISFLATANVAASTRNQALNALVFLDKQVRHIELGEFGQTQRAKSGGLGVKPTIKP